MSQYICTGCDKEISVVDASRYNDKCSDCHYAGMLTGGKWVLPKYVLMNIKKQEEDLYLAEIALDDIGVVEMVIGKDDEGFVGVLDITCELDSYRSYHATRNIDSIIEDCQSSNQAAITLERLSVA